MAAATHCESAKLLPRFNPNSQRMLDEDVKPVLEERLYEGVMRVVGSANADEIEGTRAEQSERRLQRDARSLSQIETSLPVEIPQGL